MTEIILIDDHKIVRDGIRMLLESSDKNKIIGEYDSFTQFTDSQSKKIPDVYILDISMPDINGIEASRIIKTENPNAKIIILSMYNNEEFVLKAISAGANAYLPKNISKRELLNAVEKVANGEEYFAEDIQKIIIRSMMQKSNSIDVPKLNTLSKREVELLKLIVEGKTNKEIADELFISVRTVESHKNHIMVKLELKNQVELIKFAIKEGITAL